MNKLSSAIKEIFTPGTPLCALAYAALGVILATLLLTIGFWRTLLLVLLVLIGVAIGQQADGDPKILRALGKIFRDHDTH